jgi:hypothetical protein
MRAQRKDGNQWEVVEWLRACGCVVVSMDRSAGFDLLVGLSGGRGWVCVEVKDGCLPPSGRRLTEAEAEFRELCLAKGLPYAVVETVEDVRELVAWKGYGVLSVGESVL